MSIGENWSIDYVGPMSDHPLSNTPLAAVVVPWWPDEDVPLTWAQLYTAAVVMWSEDDDE